MPSVVAFPELKAQLQAINEQLSAAVAGGAISVEIQGRRVTISNGDVDPIKALIVVLQTNISAKVQEWLVDAQSGVYDNDRSSIQSVIEPLRVDLGIKVADVVRDLFTETIDEADNASFAPIGTCGPSDWRRVESTLFAFGAIITRLERDLDTLAGLESSFFAELSETVGAMVAAEITLAAATGVLNNRPFALANARLVMDREQVQSQWFHEYNNSSILAWYDVATRHYRVAVDNAERAPARALNTAEGLQSVISFHNHRVETESANIERAHGIGDEVVNRTRATLASKVLEDRILTQLNRMISGGFFSRRRVLRERIGRDVQELRLRLGVLGKGLKQIFLFPEAWGWEELPGKISSLREWIGKLRQIDAFLGRAIATEYPLRLRLRAPKLARSSTSGDAEPSLQALAGPDLRPFDISDSIRAACGNRGRLRLKSVGLLLESADNLQCLGSVVLQPPIAMTYGRLQTEGQRQLEELPPVTFRFIRTPDMPNADTTVSVGPWENISGIGTWLIRIEPGSDLENAIRRGRVKDLELLLDFAWSPT